MALSVLDDVAESSRADILRAAASCFTEHGYTATSIDDVARRIGGTPSAMGWESQAAHLVPAARLLEVATNPNDAVIAGAIRHWLNKDDGEGSHLHIQNS